MTITRYNSYYLLMLRLLLPALLVTLALGESLSAYSTTVAKQMAYMSSIAYEPTSKIDAWSCSKCSHYHYNDHLSFTVGDMQGFTGYSTSLNSIVVAFRGSSNIDNWIKNIQFVWTDYPHCTNCKVHSGFNTYANSVKDVVNSRLKALISKYGSKTHIFVTGHSLGGVVGVLNALELRRTYSNGLTVTPMDSRGQVTIN